MNDWNIYSSEINTKLHAFYINNVPPSYARVGKLKYEHELFPFEVNAQGCIIEKY